MAQQIQQYSRNSNQ